MWILREIERRGGELGFREFMELALYHPKHGYYQRAGSPFGRDRDFLTAPTASRWYGATVAGFLGAVSEDLGRGLALVDLAAGDGSFLAAVLDRLGGDAPRVLDAVVGVDRSRTARRRARDRLRGKPPQVEISDRPPEGLDGPVVVHVSELYDAMSVHRVEQTGDGLVELTVVAEGGRLTWGKRSAGGDLERYFSNHGVSLAPGQLAEINPEAEEYHGKLLEAIGGGLVLVLDYGYPARRLYDPRGRARGSLVSYRRHELGRDLLDSPGERDLTAHVNWDDLRRAAKLRGWQEIALIPLAEFLVRAGLARLVEEQGLGPEAELDADTVTERQEIKRLLDPEGMGSDLKMLVQGRGELAEVAAEILGREV